VAASHVQIMISHVPIKAFTRPFPFVVDEISAPKVPFLIVAIVTSVKVKVVVAGMMIPAPGSMSAIPQLQSLVLIEHPMAVIPHL
jgi:hypothetical protein